MKTISEKINLLFLIMVLSIAPLQTAYSAVTGCSEMMNEMHKIQSSEEKQSARDSKHDCCKQNSCTSMQCTASVVATISSASFAQIDNIAGNVIPIQNQLFNSYFPSTLYRPPKS